MGKAPTSEDDDDAADELRLFGVPDEDIEVARERAAELSGPEASEDVVVWPENLPAVDVFRRCTWTTSRVTGMEVSKTVFEHIASTEIEAVCNLLRIPAESRRDVLDGVRVMEATARPLLNH